MARIEVGSYPGELLHDKAAYGDRPFVRQQQPPPSSPPAQPPPPQTAEAADAPPPGLTKWVERCLLAAPQDQGTQAAIEQALRAYIRRLARWGQLHAHDWAAKPAFTLDEALSAAAPTQARAPASSVLLELPLPLLEEIVAFVGDLRSTARLLHCTSRGLAVLAEGHPSLWAHVPSVRLRCQRDPPAVAEEVAYALDGGLTEGLTALELVGDRRGPIGYAHMTHVAVILCAALRLRSVTMSHAVLDDDVLTGVQVLREPESLDIGTSEVRTRNPQGWAAAFSRLRSLTIRIPVAQQLLSGRADLLKPPQGRLRALRLTSANAPGSPAYIQALVGSLLTRSALEEFGCESRFASQTVVEAIKAGHLQGLRVLELPHIDEQSVEPLLEALIRHCPTLTALRLRLPGTHAIAASISALSRLVQFRPLEEFDATDYLFSDEHDDEEDLFDPRAMYRSGGNIPSNVYSSCFRSEKLRSLRLPERGMWGPLQSWEEEPVWSESEQAERAAEMEAARAACVAMGHDEEVQESCAQEAAWAWERGYLDEHPPPKVKELRSQMQRLVVEKGLAPGELFYDEFGRYHGGSDDEFGRYGGGDDDDFDYEEEFGAYYDSGGEEEEKEKLIFRAPGLEHLSVGRSQNTDPLPNRWELPLLRELRLDLDVHGPYETLAVSEDGRLEEGEDWRQVLAMQAPRLSTFTLARAATLRAVRVHSPTLRALRLQDLPMVEELVIDAPFLDALEVENAPNLRVLRLSSHALRDLRLGRCVEGNAAASASAAASAAAAPARGPAPAPAPSKGCRSPGKRKRRGHSQRDAAEAAADRLLRPRAPPQPGVAHVRCVARLASLAVCCPHLEALRIEGAAALRGTLTLARRGAVGEEGMCCRLRALVVRGCPGLAGIRLAAPGEVGKGESADAVAGRRERPPYVAPLREWVLDGCPGIKEVHIDGEDVEPAAAGSGGWVVTGAARRALDFFALQNRRAKVTLGSKALPLTAAGAGAGAGATGAQGPPPATLPWLRR